MNIRNALLCGACHYYVVSVFICVVASAMYTHPVEVSGSRIVLLSGGCLARLELTSESYPSYPFYYPMLCISATVSLVCLLYINVS